MKIRAVILLLGALVLAVPAPASAGAGTLRAEGTVLRAEEPVRETWGIVPSGPQGPDGRAAFDYKVEAGAQVKDVVRVLNYSTQALLLKVYAADAAVTTDGGFDLITPDRGSRDLGSWARVEPDEITVAPRKFTDVPFSVQVPADAEPGDHVGGIVASRVSGPPEGSEGKVAVERRVGARIYLRVAGELRPGLIVSAVHGDLAGSPLGIRGRTRVTFTVRNEGNVRVAGRPTLSVFAALGLLPRRSSGQPLPELLPGGSLTSSFEVGGTWRLGPLSAKVEVRPDTSGNEILPARWPPGRGSTTVWAVPWALLGLGVIGGAALAWAGARRTRNAPAVGPPEAPVGHPVG